MGVIQLPPALRPWAPALSLFPEDITLTLAPMLARLSSVLGAPGAARGEAGEPDGYDGLARRGPLERLLPSEWLLLSELPDEMMRRFASNELSFFELSRRPAARARHVTALFDTGPEQLGAPRVVQLAAFIVLAARAARASGSLSWGILQDETASLQSEVSRRAVRALLHLRSPRAVRPADVERWLSVPAVSDASERWLVTLADPDREAARRTSLLRISEVLEPDARRVHVSALAQGAPRPRAIVLDLPEERACVRLVRDPFGDTTPRRERTPVTIDPEGGMVFSENRRRLYLRGSKGELVSVFVPCSTRDTMPPPSVFEPPVGQVLLAAGHDARRKRTAVLCAKGHHLVYHWLSKAGRDSIEERAHDAERDGSLEDPEYLFHVHDPTDPDASLRAGSMPLHGLAHFTSEKPPAPGAGPGVVYYIKQPLRDGLRVVHKASLRPVSLAEDLEAFRPLGKVHLVGTFDRLGPEPARRVLFLDPARRYVQLHGPRGIQPLFTAAAPICLMLPSPELGLIGYLTDTGEVGVYSESTRGPLLHLAAESFS